MFWSRDIDPAATPSVLPKPPFEARGVDTIMKLRKTMPCGGDAEVASSIPTSPLEEAGAEADTVMSIHDRLEGQRPKDIKAWLDFRVSWLLDRVALLLRSRRLLAREDCMYAGRLMTRDRADLESSKAMPLAHVMTT